MRYSVLLLLVVAALDSSRAADERVFSGPQKGEKLAPFKFRNVMSDPVGEVDLITKAQGKPVLLIFFQQRTRPAFGLMNAVMRYAQTRAKDGLNSAVVSVTDDATAEEEWLKRVRGNFPKGATYGLSTDGPEGPGAYGLNKDVQLTVLVGKDGKVAANFALVQPSLQADGPKIAKAIVDVLGGGKVPDLTAGNRRGGTDQAMRRLNPQLFRLFRQMMKRDASAEEIDNAAAAVEKFVTNNETARRQLGRVTVEAVRSGNFKERFTGKRREYVEQWARKYGPQRRDAKPARESGNKSAQPHKKSDRATEPAEL